MTEKTILIVDGDNASRKFLSRLAEQKGRRVLETSLGKEGLVFAWRERPHLIVIDPQLADLPGEEIMRKLRADARTASTPAIALSSDPSPERKAACLAAGFNEYLTKSAESVPLLKEAIDRWLTWPQEILPSEEQPASAAEAQKPAGLLIVFLSGKGGTGVSSLCANLAMSVSLSKPQARVVVLDSVLPIGSIASIVGYEGELNLVKIAALPPEKTTAAFFREKLPLLVNWNFHLVAGSPDPESASGLRAGRIEQIVQALQAAYDYVLIDLGRSLSAISLPLIQQADLTALVVSPDVSAVQLTRIVWQYLQAKGLTKGHIYPILNRVVGFEGLAKPEVEAVIGLEFRMAMPHLGGNVALANNQHLPIPIKYPHDTAALIFKESAAQMITLAERMRAEDWRKTWRNTD